MRNPKYMNELKCCHKEFPTKSKKKKYRRSTLPLDKESLSRSKRKKCTSKDIIDNNKTIKDPNIGPSDFEFNVRPRVILFDDFLGVENQEKLLIRASKSMPDILFNIKDV